MSEHTKTEAERQAMIEAMRRAEAALDRVYMGRLQWHGDLLTLEMVSRAAKEIRAVLKA